MPEFTSMNTACHACGKATVLAWKTFLSNDPDSRTRCRDCAAATIPEVLVRVEYIDSDDLDRDAPKWSAVGRFVFQPVTKQFIVLRLIDRNCLKGMSDKLAAGEQEGRVVSPGGVYRFAVVGTRQTAPEQVAGSVA